MKHGPAVCLLRYSYGAVSDAEDISREWGFIIIMIDEFGTMWLETDMAYLSNLFERITP
jgi:hypothetical protein